jgi:hypothetical protein
VSTADTELLSDTFVDLADTMVDDFDVIDFLHMLTDRSVRLLSVSAAGVVLADPRGELRVAAASSDEAGLVELSRSRTTRDRAWTASAPGSPSPPPTCPGQASGGPGSRPPRPGPGSTPCRCGCATRSSAR